MNRKPYVFIVAAGLVTVPCFAAQSSTGYGANQPQTQTDRQDSTQSAGKGQYQNRGAYNSPSQAQSTGNSQYSGGQNSGQGSMDSQNMGPRGHREAKKMTPARAVFTSSIESQKAQSGAECNVKLTRAVELNDGTKLASGTMLMGHVVNDDTQPGNARLALQFDQARMKDGQVIPVKATIVGVYNTPDPNSEPGYGRDPGTIPPSWNDGTLQIDQIDALPGIDLHSKIASSNSGVFVSTKKDNIKLSPSYELLLAVAAQNGSGATTARSSYDGRVSR